MRAKSHWCKSQAKGSTAMQSWIEYQIISLLYKNLTNSAGFWKDFSSRAGKSLLWCLMEAQSCSLLCSLAKNVLVPQFPELSNSSEDPPCKNLPPPPPPPPALLTGTLCWIHIFPKLLSHVTSEIRAFSNNSFFSLHKAHPNPPAPPLSTQSTSFAFYSINFLIFFFSK